MLLVPPRHGKSELASRRFPAFYLGHHSDRHFLSISATADLAADFGRDVRNLISGAEYGSLFETRLAADSHARANGIRLRAACTTRLASAAPCLGAAPT